MSGSFSFCPISSTFAFSFGTLLFIDVILPLALPRSFTYSVPDDLTAQVQKGVRVIVPFGARKFYSAIVREIHSRNTAPYTVKEIVSVLDECPVVNDLQIRLWHWIADYYMCTVGEVMKAAIPSGLKLESETRVFYNEAYVQCDELSKHEEEVLDIMHRKKCLPVSEIATICKHGSLMRVVQSLVDKEALWVEEVIASRYKPRFESCVRLHPAMDSETKMKNAFDALEKAPRQLEILMNFVRLSGVFSGRPQHEVTRKELLQAGDAQTETLHTLARKKILEFYTKEVSRLGFGTSGEGDLPKLTPHQQTAIEQIYEAFTTKDVVLLHGITSSGKTEIYIRLIEEQIRRGLQVLYLLPEIALTAQIIDRLKIVFGSKVGIYHSKFPDAERVEVWNNIGKPGGYRVVLGVRSSIFLPFANLGLVIVDEEHENTYKQSDPAPRYHARDAAIVLASVHGAKTLLGTATPAIESYYNTQKGKYGLVELQQRYAGMDLPEVQIADTALARKQKKMQSHFHPDLLTGIDETLKAGKQAILFQNRRGFAPYVQCRVCEHIPRCEYCDVSLTYHRFSDRLVCHYCGYSIENIHQCPVCGGLDVNTVGFGTEKIEDELQLFFPHAHIARLDLDTSRTRNSYEKIIAAFEEGKTDILVGTQMVTKGLNFENVRLAGVLNADNMLSFPDFRAHERSFQLITQVSGRAGRAGERGRVIIQASKPQHPILHYVIANDYANMYASQLAEREKYKYPPFYRLIRLTLKHKNKDTLHLASRELAEYLVQIFGRRVLGPEAPVISRVQTYYLENILLKIEKQASVQKAKTLLAEAINNIRRLPAYKSLQVVADVDPM
ncbi:MAG: primosomal protein N' [Bacteroidales bacterium]|jgi:primosomal protein N' (replication factor Y)|nr:primosomal protein N' [Bacteroidales bacterium]